VRVARAECAGRSNAGRSNVHDPRRVAQARARGVPGLARGIEQPAGTGEQLIGAERLLQELALVRGHEAVAHEVRAVAAADQARQLGTLERDRVAQLAATHARHHGVGDHEADLLRIGRETLERLDAVCAGDHAGCTRPSVSRRYAR
jgi:hypothetical protein